MILYYLLQEVFELVNHYFFAWAGWSPRDLFIDSFNVNLASCGLYLMNGVGVVFFSSHSH